MAVIEPTTVAVSKWGDQWLQGRRLRPLLARTIKSQALYSLSGKAPYHQKSCSHEIGYQNCRVTLQFDERFGRTAADMSVNFNSNFKPKCRGCEIFVISAAPFTNMV